MLNSPRRMYHATANAKAAFSTNTGEATSLGQPSLRAAVSQVLLCCAKGSCCVLSAWLIGAQGAVGVTGIAAQEHHANRKAFVLPASLPSHAVLT